MPSSGAGFRFRTGDPPARLLAFPMPRTALLALLALGACSPTFSARVADFDTPIANSLGHICWVEVDTAGAPALRSATYRATATYDADLPTLTDRVELQVFGRDDAPASRCTTRSDDDAPLSDPFELEREVAQPVEVGGDAFGERLADLVRDGTFWLGASAAGNAGIDERVRFRDGRIRVGF